MELLINNIVLNPDKSQDYIRKIISERYKIDNLKNCRIIKKSLDARNKNRIVYRYRVAVDVPADTATHLLKYKEITEYNKIIFPDPVFNLNRLKITIIGSGPAGLFCALRLIEANAEVIIFERGKIIDDRMKDISILEKTGTLNEESNVLFGEGGAGTFSDGKLNTGTNRPEINWFYKKLIECGAPDSIMYEAKPHLGTDKLRKIIKNIRKKILSSGGNIYFNERVSDILIHKDNISGIATSAGKEYPASILVIATGHSARDVYKLLNKKNINLEKKGFAVGVRVEHPTEMINSIQYGDSQHREILPSAEYYLRYNNKETGRGVYSFCMCPGGSVINASSEHGRLCTNGMSYSARNSPFSNSALAVTVNKHDPGEETFAGIDFQKKIEEAAFIAGDKTFSAPAQRITSFLQNKRDSMIPEASYKPGIVPGMLTDYLPAWIIKEIKEALYFFNKKMRGFISEHGLFIGAETRTSSPIRITRGDNFQSVSIKGLFPIGEGAGYAGGIVSSAVDGIKAADIIASIY